MINSKKHIYHIISYNFIKKTIKFTHETTLEYLPHENY